MLSEIENLLKKRVKPLLVLLRLVNRLIWKAQKQGYKIRLECWGSMGTKATRNDIRLMKFSKNLVDDNKKILTPTGIISGLKKVNKELGVLEEEGYCVDITSRRPNDEVYLFLEGVQVILIDDDFDFQQYE